MRNYIELTVLTALAVVSAVAALMHGDVLFGVVFGAAADSTFRRSLTAVMAPDVHAYV
jgi:uncharacterized MnhB-related membrane protein